MVCFDDEALADQALLFRRWGRRSELQIYGSEKGKGRDRFFSAIDDGLEYDNLFIFDENGWNFEPSELSAAFGLVQLDKLPDNLARRQHSFALTGSHFARWPDAVHPPPAHRGRGDRLAHVPDHHQPRVGHRAGRVPALDGEPRHRHPHGLDRATSPASRCCRDQEFRVPAGGLPNADRVMEWGLILPNNHSLTDDDCNYIGETTEAFLTEKGLI